jgi:nephrocystin-3
MAGTTNGAEKNPVERVIRVFVSSTFRDMHSERDHLVKLVFPELRKLCEERGVALVEVDLRWGITSEEVAEGKVVPLCLAEIERCQPFFIGLLGERYGWVPAAGELSVSLVESHPWLKDDRQLSVTEIEILHGVLRNEAMANRAIFYFRDPDYVRHLPPGANPADFESESEGAAGKLADLKRRLRDRHAAGLLKHPPRESYASPEELCKLVLRDFKQIIDEVYPDTIQETVDQESLRHDAYARDRRLGFVGREKLLEQISEQLGPDGAGPLVITGEPGSGKSALLAQWAARWSAGHRRDVVIQHYAGSSADAAGWQGLTCRVLAEVRRSFFILADAPANAEGLRTAICDWVVKAGGKRRVVLVLDAIEHLDTGEAGFAALSWLPDVVAPNVRILASAAGGESLETLRRRGWQVLALPPLSPGEVRLATNAYLKTFSKKLPNPIVARLETTEAASNPLYLRTVLDELRYVATHDDLSLKAASYLDAPDLPELLDRVLNRWKEDFGEAGPKDIVERTLCFIVCARDGLSEPEILAVLGSNGSQGDPLPLPQRYWSPLYLALEHSLASRKGILTLGNQALRLAVERCWLSDEARRTCQLRLEAYFAGLPGLPARKLTELPRLLSVTGHWERLRDFLADLPTFLAMRTDQRWSTDLHSHWIALGARFDSVEVYGETLSAVESGMNAEALAAVRSAVAGFFTESGRHAAAVPLLDQAHATCEQAYGAEDINTLFSLTELARALQGSGQLARAERLFRQALEASNRRLGTEHKTTLTIANNLADVLRELGQYEAAESFCARVLEARQRLRGGEHPDTLTSMNNLAQILEQRGDYAAAEALFRRALDGRECVLGPCHPLTAGTASNLAGVLEDTGAYAEAEHLSRRALASRERALGPEHPETLESMNNLALLLARKGDDGAQELLQNAYEAHRRVLGEEHPRTLVTLNNLALQLERAGDIAEAEKLERRALAASERTLGPDHPDTLTSLSNLAMLLRNKGDYPAAAALYRRALAASERVLGRDHPLTLQVRSGQAALLMLTDEAPA